MAVTVEPFGKNQFEQDVDLYTLTNGNRVRIRIMNHGGVILSIETPDRNGQLADVVLGHDTAAEYIDETPYFGGVVARFANRIQGGCFTLDGVEYKLAQNNGPNALHGGVRGFDKMVWNAELLADQNAVRMTHVSADGEEGFPGEVKIVMTYSLTEDNELKIDYEAESSKATPFNISNHSYFNLAGHDSGYVGSQILTINADTFLPVDETCIPLGVESAVEDTPFDFRSPHSIGERIDTDDEQLRLTNGYDHNFCLNKNEEGALSFCARAEDPVSGRVMEVSTTEPGVQFYAANFVDGKFPGKSGCKYSPRCAFCLETQHYPDSPNRPEFPDVILRPGKLFKSQTIYKFS